MTLELSKTLTETFMELHQLQYETWSNILDNYNDKSHMLNKVGEECSEVINEIFDKYTKKRIANDPNNLIDEMGDLMLRMTLYIGMMTNEERDRFISHYKEKMDILIDYYQKEPHIV